MVTHFGMLEELQRLLADADQTRKNVQKMCHTLPACAASPKTIQLTSPFLKRNFLSQALS